MASESGSGSVERLSLHIFEIIDSAQASHGIPHQDYAHYHKYCTDKLHRLRRVQAVKATLVHNPKYVEGVSGRRHAFAARNEIPDEQSPQHENILLNLLFQAERAWAQACELQQASKGKHTQIQRRLNKACKWAEALKVTSEKCCVARTVQECVAYSGWMKGNAALEQKHHLTAFRAYRTSMHILLKLVEELDGTTADALALGDVWTTRAETGLRPLVRFCQYECKDELDPTELQESSAAATKSKDMTASIIIHFQGKEIALDSYKQLTVRYLKMEDQLKATARLDESQFLQLLSDLDDALNLIHTEEIHYASLPTGPAVSAKREELQALQGFFRYRKLELWRKQQEKRVSELTEDTEILHIYDALQQNTQEMAGLFSSAADAEEDQHWLEAQAHMVRIRAFRCYYLARVYETVLQGSPQQVLALLKQSTKLSRRACEEIAACDTDDGPGYLAALKNLQLQIDTATCRAQATHYLQTEGGGYSCGLKTNRPLWMRLNELDSGTILADDPPLPIPIPCKPAFYDIAWQHVGGNFPLEDIKSYIQLHEPKKSAGIFSWFSK